MDHFETWSLPPYVELYIQKSQWTILRHEARLDTLRSAFRNLSGPLWGMRPASTYWALHSGISVDRTDMRLASIHSVLYSEISVDHFDAWGLPRYIELCIHKSKATVLRHELCLDTLSSVFGNLVGPFEVWGLPDTLRSKFVNLSGPCWDMKPATMHWSLHSEISLDRLEAWGLPRYIELRIQKSQ